MEDLPDWAIYQEERQKTFKYWPYKKGPCNPQKMAEAGFYSLGTKSEPDLAKCYVCFKELDGWEKDDNPWSEHKKHASQCPFVLLDKKPSELTVIEILTLEVERSKKILVLEHEKKVKILMELREVVNEEFEKGSIKSSKDGKENRKRKTSRATTKRSSRKD